MEKKPTVVLPAVEEMTRDVTADSDRFAGPCDFVVILFALPRKYAVTDIQLAPTFSLDALAMSHDMGVAHESVLVILAIADNPNQHRAAHQGFQAPKGHIATQWKLPPAAQPAPIAQTFGQLGIGDVL